MKTLLTIKQQQKDEVARHRRIVDMGVEEKSDSVRSLLTRCSVEAYQEATLAKGLSD